MGRRFFAFSLSLIALCAPVRSFAGVFGAPPAVPICRLAMGDVVILAPAAPAPGAPFGYRLTWQDVATWSPGARHLWGIPDGYTILSIYADRPFLPPVPRWTLIPAGADLSAWLPAPYPVLPPPVALTPSIPAACLPVTPPAPPCPPAPPVCAPPAPKPCPPVLGNPGGLGGGGVLSGFQCPPHARRF